MKIFLAFCLFITHLTGSFAQKSGSKLKNASVLKTSNNIEKVGLSAKRMDRLDLALRRMVDDQKIPGLVAIMARHGEIVYHKAYGYSDYTTKTAMKTDDIFRIASMSKAITATAVMMLYEEGHFGLDDPISNWIPEFKSPKILHSFNTHDSSYTTRESKSEITIRQLLSHTSGVGYGAIDGDDRIQKIYAKAGIEDLYTTDPISVASNIKKLGSMPLHHQPGEKFTYGMGLDVLGYFIEIVSGQSFSQYLIEHLFTPLGMQDTYFYLPQNKANRLVKIHSPDSSHKWTTQLNEGYDPDFPITGSKTWYSGGAGLCSTALDYAIFLQMLLNKGTYNGIRFLSRTTVNLLTESNQIGDLWGGDKAEDHFSLAFSVLNKAGEYKGSGSEGRYGWGGYFNTNYWADPKEKIVVVLMKQTRGVSNDDSEAVFTRMVYQTIDD